MTDYIEITTRWPIYSTLPESERVTTEEFIRAHRRTWHAHGDLCPVPPSEPAHSCERLLWRVMNPDACCKVGVPLPPEYRSSATKGKYVPCSGRPAEGFDVCKHHGGPSNRKKPVSVRGERDALRKRVAELEEMVRVGTEIRTISPSDAERAVAEAVDRLHDHQAGVPR